MESHKKKKTLERKGRGSPDVNIHGCQSLYFHILIILMFCVNFLLINSSDSTGEMFEKDNFFHYSLLNRNVTVFR